MALILLLLAGCGDDTTVMAAADMTIPRVGAPCENDGTCCCGLPNYPNPCLPFAGLGQPCSTGQICGLDYENGGYCDCDSTTQTWACHFPFERDLLPFPPPSDMTAHD